MSGGSRVWSVVVCLAWGLAACSSQQSAQSTGPVVEDKTVALTPPVVSADAPFLAVQLKNIKVTRRVEQGTGRLVDPPRLSATMTLKNTSTDHALRLISGEIAYLDRAGQPIELATDREAPRFDFYSYSNERLDPGQETSKDVLVSFPVSALESN
ncbi:MAG: hypothetical protein ACREJV_00715, partial [Candidatus Rokuibacteriota bacterium]